LRGGADQPVAQHVLFGDDGEPAALEPLFQRPDREMQAAVCRGFAGIARRRDQAPHQALILQKPLQPFARALGIAGDTTGPRPGANMIRQRPEKADVFLLALGREAAPDAPARVDHARARACGRARTAARARPASAASQAASSR
jgi:hypothetical protein